MQLDLQLLAAITAVIVAIIAWLQARDAARVRAELDTRIERLKAQLDEQRAHHDAVLRVGADARLGLFKEATRSAATAERLFAIARDEIMSAVHELGDSDENRNLQPDAEARLESVRIDFPRQYADAGLFLPPELDDDADDVRTAILKANTAALRCAKRGDTIARDDRDDILEPMTRALETYRKRARDWKHRHWGEWDLLPTDPRHEDADS